MFDMNNLKMDNFDVKKVVESVVDKVAKTPKKITIRSGGIVDAVQVEFEDKAGYRIGGRGGSAHELILEADETITEYCGTYSTFEGVAVVAYLKFTTSKGRALASHSGVKEGMNFSVKGKNLMNIRGEEAVNARGTGVYLKKIYADDTGTGLISEII